MGEGVKAGCYCMDSAEKLALHGGGHREGNEPVKCSCEDQVVVDAQLVQSLCKIFLVD